MRLASKGIDTVKCQSRVNGAILLAAVVLYALGDEPFGLEAAIDKAAELCARIGVPQAAAALEFEIQGATSRLSPEHWARGVQHSLGRGYQFRHWEIANEPYVGHAGRAFPTADAYPVRPISTKATEADGQIARTLPGGSSAEEL